MIDEEPRGPQQVLNAIAVEFICKLDNELKTLLFTLLEDQEEDEPFCRLFFETSPPGRVWEKVDIEKVKSEQKELLVNQVWWRRWGW